MNCGRVMPWDERYSFEQLATAAYEYKAVHRYANDDDEWGEIRQILKLSMSELQRKLTIPFELEQEKIRYGS